MFGIELGISHNGSERKRNINSFKKEIYDGLDLERAGFLKVPKAIEQELIGEIAVTLFKTSDELDKPLPKVALIHSWNESLPGFEENNEIREIIAHATLDEANPNGIIRISPFYLKEEFTGRINGFYSREGDARHPLGFVLSHEDFHIWQYEHQLEQVLRDTNILKTQGLDSWGQTRTELDANQAANNWIKNGRY